MPKKSDKPISIKFVKHKTGKAAVAIPTEISSLPFVNRAVKLPRKMNMRLEREPARINA